MPIDKEVNTKSEYRFESPSEAEMRRKMDSFNNTLRTIFSGLLVIGIAWSVRSTSSNQADIQTLSERVSTLQQSSASVSTKVDGLYRTTDAARDFALRDALIADLRSRESEIEKEVRDNDYVPKNQLTRPR